VKGGQGMGFGPWSRPRARASMRLAPPTGSSRPFLSVYGTCARPKADAFQIRSRVLPTETGIGAGAPDGYAPTIRTKL
jgi:hypothetical protein